MMYSSTYSNVNNNEREHRSKTQIIAVVIIEAGICTAVLKLWKAALTDVMNSEVKHSFTTSLNCVPSTAQIHIQN